jgi:hypothetical protein
VRPYDVRAGAISLSFPLGLIAQKIARAGRPQAVLSSNRFFIESFLDIAFFEKSMPGLYGHTMGVILFCRNVSLREEEL